MTSPSQQDMAPPAMVPLRDISPFEVFFDQQCPLCKREIDMIRRKDKRGRLRLVDISDPEFDAASTGKTLDELMQEIHGRYADGEVIVGVNVFREIYSRLNFGWLVAVTRWPLIGPLMNVGYRWFARLRYRSALKRMNRRVCNLPVPESAEPMSAFPTRYPSQPE